MTEFMTETQRTAFRRKLGEAVLSIQNESAGIVPPDVMIPELIAALMSLAAHVSANNANMSSYKFAVACEFARKQQWPE
jgi:hypothetical protein